MDKTIANKRIYPPCHHAGELVSATAHPRLCDAENKMYEKTFRFRI